MADVYRDNRAESAAIAEQSAIIIITKTVNNISNSSNDILFSSGIIDGAGMEGNGSFLHPYDVPTGLICLLAFLYGSISILTVIGNGLVILVIVKNMRMHTVTNIFISNLAVADVIIGLFSIPFQAALLQRWVLANFMCSLAPFVQVISVNVSIFTLAVIAVDRYIAVIHPFKAGCSKRSAAIIISVIWTVGIGAAVPVQQFYWVDYIQERNSLKPRCSLHTPDEWAEFPLYYNALLVSVQYLLPLVVITFCYCRIAWRIWGARRPGCNINIEDIRGRNKRKVVKMMIIVVCLFVLCWLPLQTYNILATMAPDVNDYKYINIIWFCSNWLAMSNSCYNPFIYGLLNEKFKREFSELFGMCPCIEKKPVIYKDSLTEDAILCRRVNNNGHIPQNRHAAIRYLVNKDGRKTSINNTQSLREDTETSQI